MADKIIYAMYDDDDVLKDAAQELVDKGIRIKDCYSPFPIHGIDPIIGVKRTRMGIVSFMMGITGTCLALLGLWYFMIDDWPMIIGGKPNDTLYHNLPAFVPVTFEFTVFCAAHGMAITYMIRNKTLPGMPPVNPDPRTTDDKFVLEIDTNENYSMNPDELIEAVKATPIVELSENTY